MVAGGKINLSRAFSKAAKSVNRFANSDTGKALGNLATEGIESAAMGGRLVKGSAEAKAYMARLSALRRPKGGGFNLGKAARGARNFANSNVGKALGKAGAAFVNEAAQGRGFSLGKTVRGAQRFAKSNLGKAVGQVGTAVLNQAAQGEGFVPMGMGMRRGGAVRSKLGYMLPRYYGNVLGDGVKGGFLLRGGAARIPNTDALSGDFLHRDINNTRGIQGSGLLPLG